MKIFDRDGGKGDPSSMPNLSSTTSCNAWHFEVSLSKSWTNLQSFSVQQSMIQRKKNGHDYDNEEINRRVNSIHQKSMQPKKRHWKNDLSNIWHSTPNFGKKIPSFLCGWLDAFSLSPLGRFWITANPQGVPVWNFQDPPTASTNSSLEALVKNTGGVFIFTKPPPVPLPPKKKQHGKKKLTKKKSIKLPKKIFEVPHICLFFLDVPHFLCWRWWCSQQPAPSTASALGASVITITTPEDAPKNNDTFQMPRNFNEWKHPKWMVVFW